ncbi:MAG: diaminopimelate decarboxylase [Clostridia bacterium]|nr:diaminopimelate decarboxylase [Clostridia bacterium]
MLSEKNGILHIDGISTEQIAKDYGTPCYVMSEDHIRNTCRLYKGAFDKFYDGKGMPLYASKAFSACEIYRIVNEEGFGVDVVSGGELYTALKAGFPASRIYFHGNNKTSDELKMAVENGVGRIVVDNIEELHMLNKIAGEHGKIAEISFRIKPGIDAHTHDFIKTGQIDSKFGVALENGEAFDIIKEASALSNVKVVGIHCHIGSQIFDADPFELAAEVMLGFAAEVRSELGITINELNLGGGFGIKYIEEHNPKAYDEYMRIVFAKVKKVCAEKDFPLPFILVEPGRSVVAESGITLYTIGSVKEIKNIRTYVSVDGGMNDNPRYALYKAPYSADIATKLDQPKEKVVTIAGRACESGDLIQEDIALQEMKAGDILVVYATGAYNYSMASNYNRVPRPPVIMTSNGKARVIVKRETYDDIIKNDIL